MPARKRELNIAMIGAGCIARAHSNAFHQVGRFFDVPFELRTKIICARDQNKLDAFASQWGWQETSLDWESVVRRADTDIVISPPDY